MRNQSAAVNLLPNTALESPSLSSYMQALGRQTNIVADAIGTGTRVGFVDYPMHINVGDLLIHLGTMDFFRSNGNSLPASFCLFDENARLYDMLDHCDVIVCHGGGNFGDIYPKHQKLRERMVKRFANKPVVVMPQSFHFSGTEAMKESAAIFRGHDNVTIFVRDEESYKVARAHFSDQVFLCPDMAHRLFDGFSPIRDAARNSAPSNAPLRLMRRDVEAAGARSINEPGAVDWSDILSTFEKARIWRYRAAAKFDGAFARGNPQRVKNYSATLSSIVSDIATRLIVHGDWTTSRLHGAIFGLLLERKVTLFDNSYGKNSRYFSLWGNEFLDVQRPSTDC